MAVYDRDYLTTLPLLYEKAFDYSVGDWNKYNDDVGDTMLKLLASASHSVDYYFRTYLNSLFLPNDDWDMKALIWELTGYKPNYLRADYLMVQLYWPDCGLLSYVPLYQYTPFKITADGVEYIFLCAEDYFIPPRTTRTNVRLVNGSLETLSMVSDKVINNKIKLSNNDIDYDLVTLKVSGEKWTQVRNVYYATDTAKIFSLHKEEDGTYLYLHKTWKEYVDAYDDNVSVYFVESSYNFDMYTDECMTIEFETELLTIDGDDVSQYYKIIPLLNSDEALSSSILMPSTTEGNRAITTLDYELNARLFPGIVCSKSFDWNTPTVCTTPFEVVVIACDDHGNLSNHLKSVLKSYLESIGSPLINVRLIAPIQMKQNMTVVLDIGEYRGTLVESQIRSIVEDTLKEFYKIGNLEPGRIVKTKELNSLLMHADPRIYFATVSFLNSLPHDPRVVPVLGTVIVLTSATTFNYYDYGLLDDKLYIGPKGVDYYYFSDSVSKDGFIVFFKDTASVNELSPIDKLPLQLFDSGTLEVTPGTVSIGSGEALSPADFAVGEDFSHTIQIDGSPEIGPVYALFIEAGDGCAFGTFTSELTSTCNSNLKFVNALETVDVNPGINLNLSEDTVDCVKTDLAVAFNNVPGLLDGSVPPAPFNISADDIYYGKPVVLGGSRVTKKAQSDDLGGSLYKTVPDVLNGPKKANCELSGASEFVYMPYHEPLGAGDENYTESTVSYIFDQNFPDLQYPDPTVVPPIEITGRYSSIATAYGKLTFTADVTTSKKNTITLIEPGSESVYEMYDIYDSIHFITTKNGYSLNWYFVSTNPLHDVISTEFLGFGIYVFFQLLRDTGLYVEIDTITSRAFIYSAEIASNQFTVTDTWENYR